MYRKYYYICYNVCNNIGDDIREKDIMKASIIKIGNSSGIIIPKGVMRSLGLTNSSELSMQVRTNCIVIMKASTRKGWSDAAKRMRCNGDDELLIPDVFEDEVFEEWGDSHIKQMSYESI